VSNSLIIWGDCNADPAGIESPIGISNRPETEKKKRRKCTWRLSINVTSVETSSAQFSTSEYEHPRNISFTILQ
jgi:hypothetical protein